MRPTSLLILGALAVTACGSVATPADPDAAVEDIDGAVEPLDAAVPDAAEPDAQETATCTDGAMNGDELAIDCGGHCGVGSCDLGQACGGDAALCSTGLCTANGCAAELQFTGEVQTIVVGAGVTQLTIDAFGAGGAANPSHAGGRGAHLEGTFAVTPGETLTVVVGGTGVPGIESSGFTGGGGGGGSGVLRGTTALVIAGGGGGAGHQNAGIDASVGPDGIAGFSAFYPGGAGGVGGADGAPNSQNTSAGGRGWNAGVPTPGEAMTNAGGWGLGGGGGGSGTNGHGGGGGGGYSGGGGGWDGGGGGGGSLNTGTSPVSTAGVQVGDGLVRINP